MNDDLTMMKRRINKLKYSSEATGDGDLSKITLFLTSVASVVILLYKWSLSRHCRSLCS